MQYGLRLIPLAAPRLHRPRPRPRHRSNGAVRSRHRHLYGRRQRGYKGPAPTLPTSTDAARAPSKYAIPSCSTPIRDSRRHRDRPHVQRWQSRHGARNAEPRTPEAKTSSSRRGTRRSRVCAVHLFRFWNLIIHRFEAPLVIKPQGAIPRSLIRRYSRCMHAACVRALERYRILTMQPLLESRPQLPSVPRVTVSPTGCARKGRRPSQDAPNRTRGSAPAP